MSTPCDLLEIRQFSHKIQSPDALDLVAHDGRSRYTDWSNAPYLNRWDDNRVLKLNTNFADNRNDNCPSA